MNDKHFDDFLRQQLQDSSQYLDDGDFSARVMAALPSAKRLHPWLEKLIVSLPVTLIAWLVVSQWSVHELVHPVYAWLFSLSVVDLIVLSFAFALSLLIGSLLWIFKPHSLF